jgi:hypothetical protein
LKRSMLCRHSLAFHSTPDDLAKIATGWQENT